MIDESAHRRSDAEVNSGAWFYYQDDHEGSVTHLTDSSGSILERYTYDAFGKPTILSALNTQLSTSAYGNRFMFTGREYVEKFGIYEYRNRAYHPGLGRFMSEDPKGFDAGDNNFFRYVGNDPLDRVDPMGLSGDPVMPPALPPYRKPDREPWNVVWEREQNATARGVNARAYAVEQLSQAESSTRGGGSTAPSGSISLARIELIEDCYKGPPKTPKAKLKEAQDWVAEYHPELHPEKYKLVNARLGGDFYGDSSKKGKILVDVQECRTMQKIVTTVAHELMHKQYGVIRTWFFGHFGGDAFTRYHTDLAVRANRIGEEWRDYPCLY